MQQDVERCVGPSQHPAESAIERQRIRAAVKDRHRDEETVLEPAHQDRDHVRVQRFVDLAHHHCREIGRIGLEPDAARQRQQNFSRVVLLAEEAEVQPLTRALAVTEGCNGHDDQHDVQPGTAHEDVAERPAPIPDEGERQRDRRQHRYDREGLAGQRVLEAAPQHHARAKHVGDADRVRDAEGGQQDQRLEHDEHREGVYRHRNA